MTLDLAAVTQSSKTRYLGMFVATTLVAYLLSTVVVFSIQWKTAERLPPAAAPTGPEKAPADTRHSLEHYKDIWERNLFSVQVQESEADRAQRLLAQIDQLSLTTLNCTLVGTIINDGGTSWAIIRDNRGGKEDRYSVGDTIRDAELVMILRNKVVLDIDGKKELLIMGIEKIRAEQREAGKGTGATGKGAVETYKISKDFVQQSVNNIADIMASVRVKPYFQDGKPAGFQVTNIKSDSILKTMGFQDGDIIRSVNGREIRSAEDVMRLYNILKDSNFFGIGLIRNKQPKTLNFKVR